MGGAESRLESTDWDAVNGECSSPVGNEVKTIDGSDPTQEHTVLKLVKLIGSTLRGFDISDASGDLVYKSRPIALTEKWFHFYNSEGKELFCVAPIDVSRRKWNVYTPQPNWPNQAPEDKVDIEINRKILLRHKLYRKVRFNISWTYDLAEVFWFKESERDLRGVKDDLLVQAEPVKSASLSAKYQCYLPGKKGDLIGYWSWGAHDTSKMLLLQHQMHLRLAKNTDSALLCIMCIVSDLILIDATDLTVPLLDVYEKKVEENMVVVAIWKDRNSFEKLLDPSDEAVATALEQNFAETAICVTMGKDKRLVLTGARHKHPVMSIVQALGKMLITVGIFRLHGIVAMTQAATEIEAATRDRPKRNVREEDLAFLMNHMEVGYSAIIASYPQESVDAQVVRFESLGAEMVWYAPESEVEKVIRERGMTSLIEDEQAVFAKGDPLLKAKADTPVSLGWKKDEGQVFDNVLLFCSHTRRTEDEAIQDDEMYGGIDRRVFSNLFVDDEPLHVTPNPDLMGNAALFTEGLCAASFYMAARCKHEWDARFIMNDLMDATQVERYGHNLLQLTLQQKEILVKYGAEPSDFVEVKDSGGEKWRRLKSGKVPTRDDWYEVRHNIMLHILRSKFGGTTGSTTQKTVKALALLISQGRKIPVFVEHRDKDAFWGDAWIGSGYNVLGKTITQALLEIAEQATPASLLTREQAFAQLFVPNTYLVDYEWRAGETTVIAST